MNEIQWDKLTPGQRAIVREVQAKYRNEKIKDTPLPKELIKQIRIIKETPVIDELDIIKHENHINHENHFRHENIVKEKHKFIETSTPTSEISNPIIEPKIESVPVKNQESKSIPVEQAVIDETLIKEITKIDKDIPPVIYIEKPLPSLVVVIDSIIHSKILGFQKELLRGDINIAEFVSLLEGLDCSTDFVEDKLDHVRMSMHEYFGLDMDMVRV